MTQGTRSDPSDGQNLCTLIKYQIRGRVYDPVSSNSVQFCEGKLLFTKTIKTVGCISEYIAQDYWHILRISIFQKSF